MSGPTQPWDQSGDPRESTVDLPRLDLSGLADYFRGGAPGASAQPSEPGPTSGPSRARVSGEPALPERAGLLEPLPEPDSGRLSRPSRQPEPAGFMDPYARPRPAGELAPPRTSRPTEPAPQSSLAPRAGGESAPGTAPRANADADSTAGAAPRANAGADLAPSPAPHANARVEPAPSPAPHANAGRLPGPGGFADASSPGHASVADFAVGPADASLARSLAPVNESARPAAAERAPIPTPVADMPPAISLDPIAGATGAPAAAAANPSPASTPAQPAAPLPADPVRAPVATAPLEETSDFATAGGDASDPVAPVAPVAPAGPTRAAQERRPPPGSVADLRSRLARLPDGHPSSPYDDGGQRRPLPTRLKQLELGLPAPGRDLSGGSWPDIDVDHGELHRTSRDQASLHPAPPDHVRVDRVLADVTGLEDDKPGDLAAGPTDLPPEEPPAAQAPAERVSDDAPLAPIRGEAASRLTRPEWEDPYAGVSGQAAPSAPGDLALGPWQAENAPAPSALDGLGAGRRNGNGNGNGTNGNGNGNGHDQRRTLPAPDRLDPRQPDARRLDPRQQDERRFDGRRLDGGRLDGRRLDGRRLDGRRLDGRQHDERHHDEPRDLARRDTIQHQVMPPGAPQPDTGLRQRPPDAGRPGPADGGGAGAADGRAAATGSAPTDDLRALVDRTLANCRAAEGRNVFGGYGSSGLSPLIHRMAAQLPVGGLAPGSEADSLKPPDRFAAKLARLMARNPGRPPEELAAAIGDAVRYAFAFEAADYIEGTWLVHRKLKSHGFELEVRRNRWESPEYKGIFTTWRDPAHGLAFEVQFHTTASWAVLRETYDIYVQITDPATLAADRAQLRARQVAAAAAAKPPPNWAEIGDFRLETR
jgi:hypothetical protein